MKSFSERKRERAEQEAKKIQEQAEASKRAENHAQELVQKVEHYTRKENINVGFDRRANKAILARNVALLVISVQEVERDKWQYNVEQHSKESFSPSDALKSVSNHDLNEQQMMDAILDWLGHSSAARDFDGDDPEDGDFMTS